MEGGDGGCGEGVWCCIGRRGVTFEREASAVVRAEERVGHTGNWGRQEMQGAEGSERAGQQVRVRQDGQQGEAGQRGVEQVGWRGQRASGGQVGEDVVGFAALAAVMDDLWGVFQPVGRHAG